MKTTLFAMLFVGATSLPMFAACQSVNSNQAADRPETREIWVSTNGVSQRVVNVPVDRTAVDANAPFALRGWEGQQPANNSPAVVTHGATNSN